MEWDWNRAQGYFIEFLAQGANLALGWQVFRSSFCPAWRRKSLVAAVTVLLAVWIAAAFHTHLLLGELGSAGQRAWVGAMGLLYAIYAVCCALALGILSRTPFDSRRRRLLVALAPASVLGYGVFIERNRIRLLETELPIPDLPEGLESIRIIQITDVHYGNFFGPRELERAVAMANECRAHLALFTGDLITTRADPLDDCLRRLASVRSEAGIFGCHGNHEFYARCEEHAARTAATLGIQILRQQSVPLTFGGHVLNIAGVDYQASRVRYLEEAPLLQRPDAFNLLLSHNPDVFPVAARQGWDLTIGGHTHGGQINVEILNQNLTPLRFRTPFIRGAYHIDKATLFVSRGLGTIGAPVRVGAQPEVNLIRLVRSRTKPASGVPAVPLDRRG